MKIITTDKAPAAIGPYSQGMISGSTVYCSGQIPVDPATGEIPAGITAQAEQSCKNVAAVLAAGGSGLENVVKTTIFLKDLGDFAEVNAAYGSFFPENAPARACVQVAKLPKDARVEIEAIAAKQG